MKRIVLYTAIATGLYAGIGYLQVRYRASQFDVFVRNEVKYAPSRMGTDTNDIRQKIIEASEQYGMTLNPSDIVVKKTYNYDQEVNTLRVDVTYSSTLDLYEIRKPLTFHSSVAVSY